MSIATEINKLRDRQESIIQEINNKGVSLPSGSSLAACATAISQIQTGGGGTSFTGHVDRVGLAAIGWTEDDIDFYQAHGVDWNEEDDIAHLVPEENIKLYTNATKVIVGGIEMADGSYFSSFVGSSYCWYLPKIDTHSLDFSFSDKGQINAIPALDYSSVNSFAYFFSQCYSLTTIGKAINVNTSIRSMMQMFYSCFSLLAVDFSSYHTEYITNMGSAFENCFNLMHIIGLDTRNCTSFSSMFKNARGLRELDMTEWNTGNITLMNSMFESCYSLEVLQLGTKDLTAVTNISYFLTNCYRLHHIDFSGVTFSSLLNMEQMLYNCVSLEEIIIDVDTTQVGNMRNIFGGCYSVERISLGNNFNYNSISNSTYAAFGNTIVMKNACSDYNSVKSILSSYNNTTTSVALNIHFAIDSKVTDDSDGTLAALKAACEAKGFMIYDLTIQSAA